MFTISVSSLLSSYSGDSQSFSFSGNVYDGYIEDIEFLSPLTFNIRIITLDDGVSVIFDTLTTTVRYKGQKYPISIKNFERIFKVHKDPLDPDDIGVIKDGMIDLGPVIREEIIMATYL